MVKKCLASCSLLLLPVILGGCGGSSHSTEPTQTTTNVALSGTSFDFGNNLVQNAVTDAVVTVTNTGTAAATLSPTLTGDTSFSIVTAQSCGAQLAGGANCQMVVSYKPTKASVPDAQTATLDLGLGNVATGTPGSVTLTGSAGAMAAGAVSATSNPQVAAYTITPPFDGTVSIDFGKTTSYGLKTWSRPTPQGGGAVTIYVAGMLPKTLYHMRANVSLTNGVKVTDKDQSFTTGDVPAGFPTVTTTTTSGMTPQPGVELFDTLTQAFATDLAGNVIWTYQFPDRQTGVLPYPVKMLPNGHLIMGIAPVSQAVLTNPVKPGTTQDVLREIDLVGNTVRELSMQTLNARLADGGFKDKLGNPIVLQVFSHDLEILPNGHLLLLVNALKKCSDLPGCTGPAATEIAGDLVVDVDENFKPVWVWNEFDALDINRRPFQFPDWTHSNALAYSKDDGNFLISIRHQNWILKVNYQDGKGDGSVLWAMGDSAQNTKNFPTFKLVNGTDPVDWFYAQHYINFVSANTSGAYTVTLMDNGDDRDFAGGKCNDTSTDPAIPPCHYTSIPVVDVDETATPMTATLTFHQKLPNSLYSSFAGNTQVLANGNIEYDLNPPTGDSQVFEVTQDANPKTVWHLEMQTPENYRILRIPSFYPGVQW